MIFFLTIKPFKQRAPQKLEFLGKGRKRVKGYQTKRGLISGKEILRSYDNLSDHSAKETKARGDG